MTRVASLLALLVLALPAARADAQPSLVILVRHAERDTAPPRDPGLTAAGHERARHLATALADANVASVITTQFQRTRLTAAPLSEVRGLTPIIVGAGGPLAAHVEAVASAVRARPAGEVVLVVGHSNTIPAIVTALGGPKLADLCDTEYATLFIMHFAPDAPPRLVRAKYGVEAPGSDRCERTMR